MGVLRPISPDSPPALPRGERQPSCDTVCALTLAAPGMDACKPATKPQAAAAAVSATECEAYDAMRANLAARVRNEAALDRKEEAAHVLDRLVGDSFEAASECAKTGGIPLAEVLARSARLVEAHEEDQRVAQSELERIGREEFAPDEARWHDMVKSNRNLTTESSMALHAERELGANMMRLRMDELQTRATGNAMHRKLDLISAAQRKFLPEGAPWNARLGTAVGERLHARAAAGSMASPALGERGLGRDLEAFALAPNEPLLSGKAMLRLARGPGSRAAELQRTLDALWSGSVLATERDGSAATTLLRAPSWKLAEGNASHRQQLAASFRDIEWLWTQQRIASGGHRGRADPSGDLVQTLDSGMWHTAERVDWGAAVAVFGSLVREDDGQPAYPGIWPYRNDPAAAFEELFGAKPVTERGSVLLRRTRLDQARDLEAAKGHAPTVRDLLFEVAVSAYADKAGIGPRQYGCYATPSGSDDERFDIGGERGLKEPQSNVLSEVVVLSEAWDGHCDRLNQERLCTTVFCKLFVNLVVKAAASGVFHGDLRRASVLFRIDNSTRRLTQLALTNFDPAHVKLVQAHASEDSGRWEDGVTCLAVVMVLCFLADVRGQKNEWVGPPMANALAKGMLAELVAQLAPKEEDVSAFLDRALHEKTLRLICDKLVERGARAGEESLEATTEALAARVKNFVVRREDAPPEVPRLGEPRDNPALRSLRGSRIPGMAARLVAHAATGADLWARQRRAGRRGKAP